MTLQAANGTVLNKSALQAKASSSTPSAVTSYTFNENIYETFTAPGEKHENSRRLKFRAGDVLTQAQVDALFSAGTFTSITPTTGLAAGGTPVTIKGTKLSGATGATIGGVAVTDFVVVDDSTITCKTGAHAAGAVPVVITDDGGNISSGASAYTYA